MATPASIQKHPVHPMLIPFPIALWIFSLICDLVFAFRWGGALWSDMAFVAMVGGLIGALVAAIPGYLDYRGLAVPETQRIGRWHMIINLSIVILFAVNLLLRINGEAGATLPLILSLIGVAMLGISGWLGGELVYVHGVAVEPQQPVSPEMKGRGRAA
jgi:uncharacterized membrane protein